jgi:hypothetical protein
MACFSILLTLAMHMMQDEDVFMAGGDDEMGMDGGQQHSHHQKQSQFQRPKPEKIERKDAKPSHGLSDGSTRASSTIVLQPGSEFLRIGWATEETPHLVPHCIARLWKSGWPANSDLVESEDVADRDAELENVERGMKRWSAPTRKDDDGSSAGAEEEVSRLCIENHKLQHQQHCSFASCWHASTRSLTLESTLADIHSTTWRYIQDVRYRRKRR